jgi:reactive intermediate/imine deaminase
MPNRIYKMNQKIERKILCRKRGISPVYLRAGCCLMFLLILAVPSIVFSQTDNKVKREKTKKMDKKFINPKDLPVSPAYSQAVSVTGGQTIYISGQIPLNSKGELVGKGDLRAQTQQVFENMKIVLAASGASFSDVVKISYFIKNFKSSDLGIIREVRSQYLPKESPLPASSLIGVESLFRDDVLIEVEAIAVVP